jgi:hypothetical protein
VGFHPIPMFEEEIVKDFEDTAWYSETVTPDANGPGKLAMARKVRELGIKVVVTGKPSLLPHPPPPDPSHCSQAKAPTNISAATQPTTRMYSSNATTPGRPPSSLSLNANVS